MLDESKWLAADLASELDQAQLDSLGRSRRHATTPKQAALLKHLRIPEDT